MSQTAISFENISKQYRLGTIGTGTLSHDLNRWQLRMRGKDDPYLKIGEQSAVGSGQSREEYLWALKDINLEVKQGEVVGIIGKNGAGKSTLLKILSRITSPTTGRVVAYGRIASLLEVGTGFHPEMTGRENVFMNGAIMGMSKREIRSKFDEIVAFSGVEKYIDTPVKRYSSGMTVRLGFAVAAHMEPEILVVDEVLAVGDAEFQNKCLGKMEDISQSEGRTILFVSHNMTAIERLCKTAVVLENGSIAYNGEVKYGVSFYLDRKVPEGESILSGLHHTHPEVSINEILLNGSPVCQAQVETDSGILNFKIQGTLTSPKKMAIEVRFYDKRESLIALYSPGHLYGRLHEFGAGPFELNEKIQLPNNLTSGEYILDIDLTRPNIETYMHIPKQVRLTVKGISSVTGLEFKYENCGYLMLK
jgi:lipopolysaccharide transport system ATP-binding protein